MTDDLAERIRHLRQCVDTGFGELVDLRRKFEQFAARPMPRMDKAERVRALAYGFRLEISREELDELRAKSLVADNPPRSQCRHCRQFVPSHYGVNSQCDRCRTAHEAWNLLFRIVDAIRTACAVAFATSIQSMSQLVAPVCGTTMDGLYSYVSVTYAGYSARRVGRCSRHGYHVGAGSAELYCRVCHEIAESRRLALATLQRILDVSLTAWWESLPAIERRVMQLDLSPTQQRAQPSDLHTERYAMLELGAPEPYVAAADSPLPEPSSAVDEEHGVRELLLEMS